MPIPASPAPLRAAGKGFSPRPRGTRPALRAILGVPAPRSWNGWSALTGRKLSAASRRGVRSALISAPLTFSRAARSGAALAHPVPIRAHLCRAGSSAELDLSGTDAWKRPWPPVWIAPSCRDTRNTETAGPSRSRACGPRAFSGLPCTEDWIWISDP